MNAKVKLVRVGQYWLDKKLLKEGYGLKDIIDEDDPVIELPELFDAERRRHTGWMICPDCGERSQVDRRNPICSSCGWEQATEGLTKCAA